MNKVYQNGHKYSIIIIYLTKSLNKEKVDEHMLYGFTCKNYASYNEECIFSMEASKIKDYDDINTITTEHGKILKSTFLYGPNGGGKSNLIKGMQYMRSLVMGSVLEPRLLRINEPFRFNNISKELPTTFEMSFIIDGIL